MNSKASVDNFLSQKNIAIVGVSRSGKKFGNYINKGLKEKGYNTFIINPNAETIDEQKSYPDFKSLPEKAEGLVVCVTPSETETVVKDAAEYGIKNIWMQQGSQSDNAIELCKKNGIDYVAGECIFMFAEPVGFGHKLHRIVWGWLGKLPK